MADPYLWTLGHMYVLHTILDAGDILVSNTDKMSYLHQLCSLLKNPQQTNETSKRQFAR